MLKLTRKADYGLMALKLLAERPRDPALSAKDVADAYGIPAQLLAKILQTLTKAGLLRSHAGMNGGYQLARDARLISAFEVILAIDGDQVRASSAGDDAVLAAMIRQHAIGAKVVLTVSRAGASVSVPVTLATAPPLPREMKGYTDTIFEFHARALAEADREDPRLAGTTTGVVIDTVTEGGWAAVGHLLKGDVILAVDGRAIANVDELSARMADAVARRPARVVFEVRRGIRTLFVAVQPTWK